MKIPQGFKLKENENKFGFTFQGLQIAANNYDMVWPLDHGLVGLFKDGYWQIITLRGYFVTHTLYKNIAVPGRDYIQMIDYKNWFTEKNSAIPEDIILQVLSAKTDGIINYNDIIFSGKTPPFFPDACTDGYFRFKRSNNRVDLLSSQWEMISEGDFDSIGTMANHRFGVVTKARLECLHDFKQNKPVSVEIYKDDYQSKISFEKGVFTINHPSEGLKSFDIEKEEWY